jgi:transposase
MFVRRTIARDHVYLKIVRNERHGKKVKQKVLFTLGRLDTLQETGELDGIVAALSRYCEKRDIIDFTRDMKVEKVYYFGAADVIRGMMERLGLWQLLESIGQSHQRLGMKWSALIFGMVLGRFIMPCSKRRLHGEWIKKIYPALLPCGEPSLSAVYRAMDVAYRHQGDIEKALFDRAGERDLFNQELDVVFYDTTTLYFESVDDERGDLRRFGYSKEHRSDCTQVVLGLLVDRDGIPVGYELFSGNTYDSKSVPAILEKLKEKYHIKRVIFIADRGMISEKNLVEIRKAELEFIVGMRLWKMEERIQKDIVDIGRYRSIGKKEKFYVREIEHNNDRLILTWSEERSERDAHVREEILEKIRHKFEKKVDPKDFVTHQGYRQYVKGLEEGKPKLDNDAIETAKKRDGFFGVLTNVPRETLGDVDVFLKYKDLWRIEDAFGEIKGPLKTRPMFHWKDHRIRAHVLICLLSYYIEAHIIKAFREDKHEGTAGEFFRALNEVYAIPFQVRSKQVWIRTEITGTAAKGYQRLKLKIPERILKLESATLKV